MEDVNKNTDNNYSSPVDILPTLNLNFKNDTI